MSHWKIPPNEVIKINVDAAMSHDKAFIATVAHDHRGYFIKAWTKSTDHLDPTVAGAATINWALELWLQIFIIL
jgi:hypothetical protein